MPGKLYMKDPRLDKAYAEGARAKAGITNPHKAGSPAYDAWQAGADSQQPVVKVKSNKMPEASWTKTQLKKWLDEQSIDYASDASKAELQTLAGIN
jgi:hypothetical protein